MGRNLVIGAIGLFLLLACENEPEMNLYSTDQIYQKMHVDFSVDILDSASGTVRLIDHTSGVDRLEWMGAVKSHWVNIPDSYPGDTLILNLNWPGTYVIQLVGSAYGRHENSGELTTLKATKVKSFELLSNLAANNLKPYLLYLKMKQFPALDEHALPWDVDLSGPDVGINLSYIYDDEYIIETLLKDTLHNLQKDLLPVIQEFRLPFSIMDTRITFEMIDVDSRRENKYQVERMALESFTIHPLDAPGQPDTIEYSQNYFTIGVEWK